jgi:transcriptional regulator with PAS, ATPase and Fis domain
MTDRIKNNAMPHRLELDHVDYLSVFRDFDEGVIITDMAGVIVYYNEAMASIDDLVPEDVVGKKVTEIYDLTDDTSNVMECIKNGRPIVNRHSSTAPVWEKSQIPSTAYFPCFAADARMAPFVWSKTITCWKKPSHRWPSPKRNPN